MYINSNTIVNNTSLKKRKTLTLDSGHLYLNLKSEPSNLAQKSLNKETTLTLLKQWQPEGNRVSAITMDT